MSQQRARPLSEEEIRKRFAKLSYDSWVQPKSGDLLGDAKELLDRIKVESDPRIRARYGRASLLLSIAAIEAITNDGLAAIYWLLGEPCPSGFEDNPPLTYFRRTSWNRVRRLLERGTIVKKIEYLFRHIERLTYIDIPNDLRPRIRQIFQIRNRIAHMTYLLDPKKYFSVFNDRQVAYTAKVAYDTAKDYINLLKDGFEEIGLPIETIRPDWWFKEELSYPLKWEELKSTRS